jgi:hypothetical protein
MVNALKGRRMSHGKLSPQAPIENPNGVPSLSPGLRAQRATPGNIPQGTAADCEAAREREFDLRPIPYSLFLNQVNRTATNRKSSSHKLMQAKKSNVRCHFTSPKPILGPDAWKLAPCRVEAKRRRVHPLNFLPLLTLNYPQLLLFTLFGPPRGGIVFLAPLRGFHLWFKTCRKLDFVNSKHMQQSFILTQL